MVAETLRLLARLVLGRLSFAVRTLVALHLQVLRREAQQDAQRLATALVLVGLGAAMAMAALLVLNAAAAALLWTALGSWPLALGALGGGELLLGAVFAGVGYSQALRKPLLAESRAMLAETARSLTES